MRQITKSIWSTLVYTHVQDIDTMMDSSTEGSVWERRLECDNFMCILYWFKLNSEYTTFIWIYLWLSRLNNIRHIICYSDVNSVLQLVSKVESIILFINVHKTDEMAVIQLIHMSITKTMADMKKLVRN